MTKEEVYKIIDDHYLAESRKKVIHFSRKAGSYHNAEDVVQEAYLRAFKYWESYDPDKGTFVKWFNRIVNNALMDHFRAERGRGMVVQSLKEETLLSEDVAYSTRQAIATLELKEVLAKMDAKPANVKEILYLNLIDGYTSKEVADIVSENVVKIWNIVRDFRKELRADPDYVAPATGTV